METRVIKVLTDDDISKIANTVNSWRKGEGYEDIPGFCKSVSIDEIKKNGYVLTPGRYVGFVGEEDDGEPFEEKMKRFTTLLKQQQKEGVNLDHQITENLKRIGYEI